MKLRIGPVQTSYSARGIPSYWVEMSHDALRKHRLIKGSDHGVVARKAELQGSEWNEQWRAAEKKENERRGREGEKSKQERGKQQALTRTEEAQRELARLGDILTTTLNVDDRIDWDQLLDQTLFADNKPVLPRPPVQRVKEALPPEPKRDDGKYRADFGLLDRILASRREQKVASCDRQFQIDHKDWREAGVRIESEYAAAVANHAKTVSEAANAHAASVSAWVEKKEAFQLKQKAGNEAIERKRQAYLGRSVDAILEYCDIVLSSSIYPDYFKKEFEFDYHVDAKMLVIAYGLPAPDDLPTLREVKYVANRDEFVEQHVSDSQRLKTYDSVLYQIVLRTIHEIMEADVVDAVTSAVFNGYVTSIDRSTGKSATACVLSLQATKEEFGQVDLANVDPRACFKALKGVGSSKLHGLAAVAPILQLRREDGRFVAAHDVANTLDESTNLAAMDWEEFEHLIRELFEKEFSASGGEVKVTRASRDGGVDAIAFDPDPIRGGKIVIQAKRYTNTVGVSAVRDLYGTVMNEGANKGILVTTSDYGPDAYAFVVGKPLVLLSGANLLHMLEKHGHRARIDIAEARRLME